MGISRTEILPGVFLNHLESKKFKTSFLSVSLLTQLSRETASMNALIPFVLRRGTRSYPDMERLAMRMDELYGTAIEPAVRRFGEIQATGFLASFPEADFLPAGSGILEDCISLIAELLIAPVTRGGLFLPDVVESEKEKLCDIIRSRVNDKRGYALTRCMEEMCCFEDFAVGRLGSVEDCEAINYKKLTKQYHTLLQSSPVEIFYCGRADRKTLAALLKDALCTLPRGEIDYDIGTDIRMNAVNAEPRFFEESLDVTQGKLCIGFRLGECMEDPDFAALYVFNAVFGSGVNSKLFVNVRERLNICYYASSALNLHKGLLFVNSGIEFDKFDLAKDEILRQLEEIRLGHVSEDELAFAKAGVSSDMAAMVDCEPDLEGFYLSNIVEGLDFSPEEMAELVRDVSLDDVVAVANSVECDLIYFLKGEDGDDEDDED